MKISKDGWQFAKAHLNEARTEELELMQKMIVEILNERKAISSTVKTPERRTGTFQ